MDEEEYWREVFGDTYYWYYDLILVLSHNARLDHPAAQSLRR